MSKCIVRHPDGKYLFLKCLEGLDPLLNEKDGVDNIVFSIRKDDDVQYSLSKKILSLVPRYVDENINIKIFCLKKDTNGPAETVYQTIKELNISGGIIIKDMDNKLIVPFPEYDDFVVGQNLFNLSDDSVSVLLKSFLVINEQGHILDIIEKNLKSEIVSLGMYGFGSAEEFCESYQDIKNSDYGLNRIYISHIIAYLIGYKSSIFHYIATSGYESYGSDKEWETTCQKYEQKYSVNKNKLAIFDLDGTLFDTKDVNYYAYKNVLLEYGFDIERDYYYIYCNGKKYTEFLPEILKDRLDLMEYIHERKKQTYHKYLKYSKRNEHLFYLIRLMRINYHIALVTTASRKNCMELLCHFDVREEFDLILTQDDVSNVKPDPEGFLKAMEKFSVKTKDTIVFEDSEEGIEAAKRCGIDWYRCGGYN